MKRWYWITCGILAVFLLAACGSQETAVLRLATTTSTYDSGLLDAILPDFEEKYNARVDVVAVGTGQAIALGEAGDADVILVHARTREDQFVAEGHALFRADVMVNDFVIVGPANDPAAIRDATLATDALRAIAKTESPFVSRGDDSGTHIRERSLWEVAGLDPEGMSWYNSVGQGMGATLIFANEINAYTLTDRGTFLSIQDNLPNLQLLVKGRNLAENDDPTMLNEYGVLPINPEKGGINEELAAAFITWITSPETQATLGNYGVDKFDQPLFYPNAQP
ncbi:Tungstate ABC transporter, substrate-binding protein [hydrothermal vent metagenome]|uniref:Tungstate ABC transporter, substrate-binding protein n=1 Tax=hydrothermal vent metagenome TaxID=652676 RepID=A0A3B0V0U5_9ZZZZ